MQRNPREMKMEMTLADRMMKPMPTKMKHMRRKPPKAMRRKMAR